jgi:hypothetical protein
VEGNGLRPLGLPELVWLVKCAFSSSRDFSVIVWAIFSHSINASLCIPYNYCAFVFLSSFFLWYEVILFFYGYVLLSTLSGRSNNQNIPYSLCNSFVYFRFSCKCLFRKLFHPVIRKHLLEKLIVLLTKSVFLKINKQPRHHSPQSFQRLLFVKHKAT